MSKPYMSVYEIENMLKQLGFTSDEVYLHTSDILVEYGEQVSLNAVMAHVVSQLVKRVKQLENR